MRRRVPAGQLTSNAVIKNPFVGHVLINDRQTMFILEKQEGVPVLTDETTKGSVRRTRLRPRAPCWVALVRHIRCVWNDATQRLPVRDVVGRVLEER